MSETIDAEMIPPTQALAVRDAQQAVSLFRTDDPAEIVVRASSVATSLKAVIQKQGLISKISGKEYPRCEAWTLLGTMLGVFPVLCWSRAVDGGWEARVEARTRDGAIVGAAEAQCLRGERNWKDRDDFALRSMAQTRATAKCLRMPLGFVMTLAGYEATPAEEMTQEAHRNAPQRAATPPPPSTQPRSVPAAPATCQVPFPTPESRQKMILALKAGPGQPNRDLVSEYFRKIENLGEGQNIESLELRFVPATTGQMKALSEKLAEFGSGERATAAFPPHTSPAPEQRQDDEWWRDVVVVVPRKGMKRDEYLRNPDTIGSLFDLRHGTDEASTAARSRLWWFVGNYEPKGWTKNDGTEMPPNKADIQFREALDAFKAWFDKQHPGEKL